MQTLPRNLRIGVLRGGPSSEYDVSLQSGANVLKVLSETHKPIDIFISRDGIWHIQGVPRSPEKILLHIDVVFNALHGSYGEDGKVQHILTSHGIPFTGSSTLSSAIAMNKAVSKDLYLKHNIKTPNYTLVRFDENLKNRSVDIFKSFIMPVIIKPVSSGSSFGVSVVRTIPEIAEAIQNTFRFGKVALVEEFIQGKEATCGVVDNFRGEDIYALMPIEIKHKKSFFDYDSKYLNNETEEICPGNFFEKDKKIIEQYAKDAHKALGLKHYSRSDFIVSPKRGVFILETNSLPGLTEKSLIPKSLEAVGISIKDFIHHLLHMAINKK